MSRAPDGRPWSKRQALKNDVLFGVARVGVRVALALPRPWLPWLGRQTGRLAHALLGRERRRARANLERVYPTLAPGENARLAALVFQTLGENLLDTVALLDPGEKPGRTLALPDRSRQVLAQALGAGRGVVYVTGHLGPWERMAALLASQGFPISTVAKESYDPRFHPMLYDRLRAARDVHAIYRGRPGAAFAMARALKRGRVLGFPMDLPGRVPTQPVRLLGQASFLPMGPARIALRSGAAVVVGTPAPGSGHGARLQIAIDPIPTADLDRSEAGAAALTQRIADALSARIDALRTHWPWMHPSFGDATVPAAVAGTT